VQEALVGVQVVGQADGDELVVVRLTRVRPLENGQLSFTTPSVRSSRITAPSMVWSGS
jgi:hypothetical protein